VQKISLGKTGMLVSRIGFGGIPIQGVTEEEAIAVVRRTLDLGVNYIDTANAYGTSQERIGKALAGLQPKPFLAIKSFARDSDGVKIHLADSLKKLGVESVDLFQFHSVPSFKELDAILAPGGAMAGIQEAKKLGQVRHIGISTHQIDVAKKILKSGRFETLMYPFNFIMNEAAEELLPLARENGVGFIAIKALAGGRLKNVNIDFKYLFQFPDILVLPGIARIKEIEEIVKLLEKPQMTPVEKKEMLEIREKIGSRFCRHCDYCMPCPKNIPVSMVLDFEAIAEAFPPEMLYAGRFDEPLAKASECDGCGECEKKCRYHVPVKDLLAEYVASYQSGKKKYQAKH
jgi:uncharacterized protein